MLKKVSTFVSVCACCAAFSQNVPTYYISQDKNGNPKMPPLYLNLSNVSGGYGELVFKSSSEHKKRGTKDNIIAKTSAHSGVWNIQSRFGGKIFGGNAAIYRDGKFPITKFKIRGKNPADTDVQKFISANTKVHWYAYAVARHESRQRFYVFNQFNTDICKASIRGIPNCGLPDGWGIMQIDSARGSQITTDEVYDWRKNVLGGLKVMDKARKEAQSYFDAVKRTFPEQWEEPPKYVVVEGTHTRLACLDACVIQLYNGASVVRRLKTAFGTYTSYRSAFVFDENADDGERWKFKPNINKYVSKVVRNEIEGGIKIQNEKQK